MLGAMGNSIKSTHNPNHKWYVDTSINLDCVRVSIKGMTGRDLMFLGDTKHSNRHTHKTPLHPPMPPCVCDMNEYV